MTTDVDVDSGVADDIWLFGGGVDVVRYGRSVTAEQLLAGALTTCLTTYPGVPVPHFAIKRTLLRLPR